jgi:hypothetical protein
VNERRGEIKRDAWKLLNWGFAGLGILTAISIIFLAVMMLGFMSEPRRNAAPVAGKAAAEQFSVQDIAEVRGTDLIGIQIGVGSRSGSYSSGGFEQRNLILLNRLTGDSRKLLTDNSRRVQRIWYLPPVAEVAAASDGGELDEAAEAAADAKSKPVPPYAYFVLAVYQAKGDTIDLLVGDLASGRQRFVQVGIDGVDRIWMLTPTRIAILLRDKLKLQYRVIDVPTLKLVTSRPVDIG